MPVFQLEKALLFPPTHLAESDGLLAIGADLSVDRLLLAYQNGIFPWFSEGEPILWYAPHQRTVIFPNEFHASKSLRRLYAQQKYSFSINKDFEQVIEKCSSIERIGQDGTWITEEMMKAFIDLYHAGFALSVEVWNAENQLVGGIYGVILGRFFAGESMFSSESNGSKLALWHLIQHIDLGMIDCQMPTPHLSSLGAREISQADYKKILNNLLN